MMEDVGLYFVSVIPWFQTALLNFLGDFVFQHISIVLVILSIR